MIGSKDLVMYLVLVQEARLAGDDIIWDLDGRKASTSFAPTLDVPSTSIDGIDGLGKTLGKAVNAVT